jgi:tRNA G10  N-methylase Trm11
VGVDQRARAYFGDDLHLFQEQGWEYLPSTKIKRPKRGDPFGWCYTYTAFSLAFARAALRQLGAGPGSSVIDPFVGSGTTMIAAALSGSPALGIDISPFSALLSRTRVATSADIKRVLAYLNKPRTVTVESSALELLQFRDEKYAAAVVARVLETAQLSAQEFWKRLLGDDSGRYDSEAVTLLSLSLGARDSAQLVRGSNPIWYRKLQEGEVGEVVNLQSASKVWARTICNDLLASPPIARKGTRVINADITNVRLQRSFDFCLTSPPYLNRLDYVIAHLPELSVLKHIAPMDVTRLRASMIGTTKIVSKDESPIPDRWGESCRVVLDSIWNHKAYASRRYYYHTYRQYFSRLYRSLETLTSLLRAGGQGIIVIQDSFYKDVNIPTPSIAAEMMQSLGWQSKTIRTATVKAHMGRMSPKQESYAPHKTLGEAAIYFYR